MLKYVLAAQTLKAFSLSPSTMRLYRGLGNRMGARKRENGAMPGYYLERVKRMIHLHERYGIVKDGDRIMELGTGWLHWEAITARLFYDVQGVLFDVWDNRQMSGMKNYLSQLDGKLSSLEMENARLNRAHELIAKIVRVETYAELYDLLGFQYIVDESGRLGKLEKGSFDVVMSGGVLEHVGRDASAGLVQDIASVLKPGGYSCHSIQIGDHLYQYDRSVSPKQYLRYSDDTWKRWFENGVQYINRLQRSDWIEMFKASGLTLVEEEVNGEPLSGMKVAEEFQHYDETDLRCSNLKLLHHKPR